MPEYPRPTPSALEAAQAARASAEAAADALRVSELRYRRLFEAARDGILILDSQTGRIIDANPFMAELLGYSHDEFLGKELWEIGLLRDKQTSQEAFQKLQQESCIRYENLPLENRNGERREVEFVSNLYRENGHAVIQCNIRDNTDRKAAEREAEAVRGRVLAEAVSRADHDPLTGLFNHRAFYKRLEEETVRASREALSLAVVVLDLDNFKFFNDVYGHAVGDEVLRSVAERLRAVCRPYDVVARFGGDEFALLLVGIGSATHAEIAARLRGQTGDLSFLPEGHDAAIPVTLSVGVALFPDQSLERMEVVHLADTRLLRAKTGGAADSEAEGVRTVTLHGVEGFSLLDALVTAVDNKDRYTRHHSEEVLTYSLLIAGELGLSQAEQRTLGVAALLHDVGKIGVPDAILRKPGKLSDAEFEAVKRHPQMGAIIVSAVPGLSDTLDAVRHHHERWDGQGYPDGLRAEGTPLLARVMAVADAFSAMTADRPYRKGLAQEAAVTLLREGAGTQWDVECVAALLRTRKQICEVTTPQR